MKVTIEYDPSIGQFAMSSEAGNFETIGLLEVAKAALIKKGMAETGVPNFQVRKVDK